MTEKKIEEWKGMVKIASTNSVASCLHEWRPTATPIPLCQFFSFLGLGKEGRRKKEGVLEYTWQSNREKTDRNHRFTRRNFGSLLASVQVDSIGKECADTEYGYRY